MKDTNFTVEIDVGDGRTLHFNTDQLKIDIYQLSGKERVKAMHIFGVAEGIIPRDQPEQKVMTLKAEAVCKPDSGVDVLKRGPHGNKNSVITFSSSEM